MAGQLVSNHQLLYGSDEKISASNLEILGSDLKPWMNWGRKSAALTIGPAVSFGKYIK